MRSKPAQIALYIMMCKEEQAMLTMGRVGVKMGGDEIELVESWF